MHSNSASAILYPNFKSFYKIGSSFGKNVSRTVKGMLNMYEFLEKKISPVSINSACWSMQFIFCMTY